MPRRTVAFTLVFAAAIAPSSMAQSPGKPAQYWMSIATQNMTIPGMSREDAGMAAMMGGMGIGGMGGPQRSLVLQLVGPGTPPGPQARHEIPPGQKMGAALPLRTPETARGTARGEPGEIQQQPEKPKGRMLIYWGCGEEVRAGQPRVLDVAKMSAQDYAMAFSGRAIPRQTPPSPRSGWTYGDWPNEDKPIRVPADSSLQGDHAVRGNYTPDIRFQLDARRDFMDPVVFSKVEGGTADAIRLQWKSIPTATGYFALAMGSNEGAGDMVFWSSSEIEEAGWALLDYLPNAAVRQLVRDKVILPPDVIQCAIPRGIFRQASGAMLQFIAYGDELNLAQPPRPRDPKAPWNPVWTAKVRLKSTGMLALGEERESPRSRASGRREAPSAPARGTEAQAKPSDQGSSPAGDITEGVKKLKGLFGF